MGVRKEEIYFGLFTLTMLSTYIGKSSSLYCYLCKWNSRDGQANGCAYPFDESNEEMMVVNCPDDWNCTVQQHFTRKRELWVKRECAEQCDFDEHLQGITGTRAIECCWRDFCNSWDNELELFPPVQIRYTCGVGKDPANCLSLPMP